MTINEIWYIVIHLTWIIAASGLIIMYMVGIFRLSKDDKPKDKDKSRKGPNDGV